MAKPKKPAALTSSERYQRTKAIREDKSRHDRIVGTLSSSIVRDFEGALEEFKPECVLEQFADGSWPKSQWTDWSSDPEQGEPYERPTRRQARLLCEPEDGPKCPLIKMCLDYALATGQPHGVWGSRVIENSILEK